jgi:hypothetical protein
MSILTQQHVAQREYILRKKKIIECFLIFLIFYVTRGLMVYTGIMFIYIPVIDSSLFKIIEFASTTPELYNSMKIAWLRFTYSL